MRRVVLLAATVLATSCGSDSPVAPTGDAATIRGTVNGKSTLSAQANRPAPAASAGIIVTVMGTSLSTTTNAAGQFVLTGITTDRVTLRFQGQGIDATLVITGLVGGQTLTISVSVSGSQASLDDEEDQTPAPSATPTPSPTSKSCFSVGAKADVEGLVTENVGSSITVAQQGKGSYVCVVSGGTRIRHGNKTLQMSDLTPGTRVHVSGSGLGPAANGLCQVAASEIKVQ